MSDILVRVLPNGHLVMPPELHRLLRRVQAFTVTEQDGSLLLTPVRLPETAMQKDLLSPALERQAVQRRDELSRWQNTRCLTEESKSRIVNLFGLLSKEDIPSDTSENFRGHLYGTQQ